MRIEEILSVDTRAAFEKAALSLFRMQARECPPYAEYVKLIGCDPASVSNVGDIPFLPIEFFKSHRVYCGAGEPEKTFTSSTTGGGEPSRHHMARLSDYRKTFEAAFSLFYGDPRGMSVYALLPGYLERNGSSLVYMAAKLIERSGGGFYLHDHERLLSDISSDPRPKLLLGVSHALWELAERHPVTLKDTVVMETGGMKGRREEITKEELHSILTSAFGVGAIHSEYGMAELSSQAYSAGDGLFRTPPWMSVSARDLNDPFAAMPAGTSGGINIIDLANISSCAFIQTQDVGTLYGDGSFRIHGRADRSEIRGCNLLVQ